MHVVTKMAFYKQPVLVQRQEQKMTVIQVVRVHMHVQLVLKLNSTHMKYFFSFIKSASVIILCLALFSYNIDSKNFKLKSGIIKVVFDNKMTFDELSIIKLDLQKKKVNLNFDKLEFDKNHHLKKIKFSVNCNDGFSGEASTDVLPSKSNFGFIRNYSENSLEPFIIGGLH